MPKPIHVPLPELAALFSEAGLSLPESSSQASAAPQGVPADSACPQTPEYSGTYPAASSALLEPLAGYLELLMQWNRVMNLVGARSWREAFRSLVVDSFHLAAFLESLDGLVRQPAPQSWDLGAGAGLPGLPLRMIWQKGEYWLVEAREKRALFLSTVLSRYPLSGTKVFRGRAEAFMAGPPARVADLVLSRAFMPWPDVLRLTRPYLAAEGRVVLMLREEVPEQPCPGWTREASCSYKVEGVPRFFCALRPVSA